MSSPLPRPEVIVYGTVCLDRFLPVDADGNPLTEMPEEMPGGEAFNTATALAGWGVDVLLTGTAIGRDPEGNRLRHLLDSSALGLPRTYIPDDANAVTPVCTVRVFPDGERHMSGRGFAEAVAPLPLPDSLLAARPLYTCDPNLGPPAVEAALNAAAAGCPVVAMDFAPIPQVVQVSRLLVTSREFLAKQGVPGAPEEIARRLLLSGAQTAIVTRGADGCLVADRDAGVFPHPAFPLGDVVDTTGAGDTFRAGLCYGLLRDLSLSDTVRFASAAAALHCRVRGGGSRVPVEAVQHLAEG